MTLPFVLSILIVPALASADVDPRFAKLRDAARPVGSLGSFLENYIGECSDFLAGAECRERAAEFRKEANTSKWYMIINEDQANMLKPGPYDPVRGEYTVNIAPLFAAGGYAVTHGQPRHTDANGNPVVMYVQAKGRVPPGWNAMSISRLFSTRSLRVQVVFTPQGVWALAKKGGGKMYGVKAKVDAIYVTIGRTGEPVALWTSDRK
ncbi:MAG: hypothetical protein IRZ16_02485 [Myxococcaceae bacterium]|nr:hypothetical protein [Myxococcaceae bacterium]